MLALKNNMITTDVAMRFLMLAAIKAAHSVNGKPNFMVTSRYVLEFAGLAPFTYEINGTNYLMGIELHLLEVKDVIVAGRVETDEDRQRFIEMANYAPNLNTPCGSHNVL